MKKHNGVTLLELTIAMAVLMVVVGAIFIASDENNNDYRILHNASLSLQADLRFAQRLAVIEGREIGFEFQPARNRYRMIKFSPTEIFDFVYLQNDVEFCDSFLQTFRVTYRPRGTPTNSRTIALTNGIYRQEITIVPSGGRVEIKPIEEAAQ
jgi:Tfp pilus assembly protein FimT